MSQGANVRSVDAIKDFKVAMINFGEDARVALSSAEMEVHQIRNWLQRDQLTYWQSQVKRLQEQLSMARADLFRRQLSQSNSDAVSDTEQKEAVRDVQRKLREAEDKVVTIKKWIPVLDHAIAEYNSASQPLGDRLSGGFLATLNVLEKMIRALDSYLAMAPPTAPVIPRARAEEKETQSEAPSTAAPAATVSSQVEEKAVKAPPATGDEKVEEKEGVELPATSTKT